jgi:hypothetical protein
MSAVPETRAWPVGEMPEMVATCRGRCAVSRTAAACGRYLERTRIDGEHPQFGEKTVVLDSRSVNTLLAIPL